MNTFLLASFSLVKREVVRFLRQRNRIIGALGTPLVFWFLIGSGLGKSFRSPVAPIGMPAQDYLMYFFPGTVVLILLFTAIFSTISIIEDRREGFLQAVLVSPAPRASIVMGKILGGTILATLQGCVFLCFLPLLQIPINFSQLLLIILMMFLLSFGLTGLGFMLAWKMDSTQGFHAIMNLFLMPMWFLSGALFPSTGAPMWLQLLMKLNPLTYGVSSLHALLFSWRFQTQKVASSLVTDFSITLLFSALMFVICFWVVSIKGKK